ncbi:hypothetical protein [Halobacillus yeomjeoni]|uniref:Uncharacterized protein n=1 Tax=Halobacillus yeomjeoni TaxID=311194 RepID=A0A931HU83_9BACI|nr:hypothetical protein [Halobacillus yeomjeoni]MBH0229474.1 hypothetical protein [Halobacillus yeomjeoni]
MPMEQEVYPMLVGGFVAFMSIAMIVVIYLRMKRKRRAYNWFLTHLLFFSASGYFLLKAMAVPSGEVMSSEEASIHLAQAGLLWAVSMVCLMGGFLKAGTTESR